MNYSYTSSRKVNDKTQSCCFSLFNTAKNGKEALALFQAYEKELVKMDSLEWIKEPFKSKFFTYFPSNMTDNNGTKADLVLTVIPDTSIPSRQISLAVENTSVATFVNDVKLAFAKITTVDTAKWLIRSCSFILHNPA